MAQVSEFLPPVQEIQWSSWALTLIWPNPSYCSHLVNEQMEDLVLLLSVCLSLFLCVCLPLCISNKSVFRTPQKIRSNLCGFVFSLTVSRTSLEPQSHLPAATYSRSLQPASLTVPGPSQPVTSLSAFVFLMTFSGTWQRNLPSHLLSSRNRNKILLFISNPRNLYFTMKTIFYCCITNHLKIKATFIMSQFLKVISQEQLGKTQLTQGPYVMIVKMSAGAVSFVDLVAGSVSKVSLPHSCWLSPHHWPFPHNLTAASTVAE